MCKGWNPVAEPVLQWKGLMIDEISMVSAKPLAEIDLKLQEIMKKGDNMKMDTAGVDGAFGGLNVLLVGDFWQLHPPEGGLGVECVYEYILCRRP